MEVAEEEEGREGAPACGTTTSDQGLACTDGEQQSADGEQWSGNDDDGGIDVECPHSIWQHRSIGPQV